MSETSEMNVYRKLQLARVLLQNTKLSKSGKNKFAGYDYFELSDFLPAIQNICEDVGLCGVFKCDGEMAYLIIYNTEKDDSVVFSAPMSTAALKGCHEVQNLGAVISYLRRYLWVNAFEIVEHDALDATTGSVEPAKKVTPVTPKPEAKPELPQKIVGKEGEWQIVASHSPEGSVEDWLKVVEQASTIALELAGSEADVMAIFKKNKVLFDNVKAQNAEFFKDLMAKFTDAKNKFKEAA